MYVTACDCFINQSVYCAEVFLDFFLKFSDSSSSSSSSKEWQFYVMPGQTDLIHVPTTRT